MIKIKYKTEKYFKTKRGLFGFILGVMAYLIFFLLPIIWILVISFKPNSEAIQIPPKLIFKPIFDNYITVFSNTTLMKSIINSFIISTSVTALTVICAVTSAYAFTRFQSAGSKGLSTLILITRMIPGIVLGLPLFIIASKIHILDTYFIMIIAVTTFALPFQIWMLFGFFQQIPKSLDEAALIDGCNWYQAFLKIILPAASPGIAATAIMTFLFCWNDLFFAVVLTRSAVKTAPLAVLEYVGFRNFNWAAIMASGVILMIPTLIVGFSFQKYMIKGLTAGAVKG